MRCELLCLEPITPLTNTSIHITGMRVGKNAIKQLNNVFFRLIDPRSLSDMSVSCSTDIATLVSIS